MTNKELALCLFELDVHEIVKVLDKEFEERQPAAAVELHVCPRHDFDIVPDPAKGCEKCIAAAVPEGLTAKQAAELLLGRPATPDAKTAEARKALTEEAINHKWQELRRNDDSWSPHPHILLARWVEQHGIGDQS